MSENTLYVVEDFQDLPFDVSKHAEALKSFTALDLAPHSIRPTLRARDLVFIRIPSCHFRIGVTVDPIVQENTENGKGSIAFEMICHASTSAEAQQIRHEVERYFLRHYPGRTLSCGQEAGEEKFAGNYVYITCYRPND